MMHDNTIERELHFIGGPWNNDAHVITTLEDLFAHDTFHVIQDRKSGTYAIVGDIALWMGWDHES